MTESKTPLTSAEKSATDAKTSSDKSPAKAAPSTKSSEAKSSPKATSTKASSTKVSKLAVFAVLIAIAVPAGHYYWQQQQHQQLSNTISHTISQENNAALSQYQSQMQQALAQQQQRFDQQLQHLVSQIQHTSQEKIIELDATVAQLKQQIKQRQPSDWLLHEAEYLIRIATRTLWLEHDTKAAIGLLKDADMRLTELNDPAFLPVREVIHQDINALELLPALQTDEVVLTLMTMSKQVSQLSLTIEDLGKENEEDTLALSTDISDWQSNLAKTWQQFVDDFIRVRQRTGTIEPLMSPQQQENLRQNLSLKIQLALWAASERKGNIYQKSLADIEQWLNEFFNMKDTINQQFANTLTDLKQMQVNYDYPSELGALIAIRATLRNQQLQAPTLPVTEMNEADHSPQELSTEKETTEPEQAAPAPEKSTDEGNI